MFCFTTSKSYYVILIAGIGDEIMNNHVMLIGKIHNDIEKIEENDQVTYQLMLNISRNFKTKMVFMKPMFYLLI